MKKPMALEETEKRKVQPERWINEIWSGSTPKQASRANLTLIRSSLNEALPKGDHQEERGGWRTWLNRRGEVVTNLVLDQQTRGEIKLILERRRTTRKIHGLRSPDRPRGDLQSSRMEESPWESPERRWVGVAIRALPYTNRMLNHYNFWSLNLNDMIFISMDHKLNYLSNATNLMIVR